MLFCNRRELPDVTAWVPRESHPLSTFFHEAVWAAMPGRAEQLTIQSPSGKLREAFIQKPGGVLRLRSALVAGLAAMLVLVIGGCRSEPLIHEVHIRPSTISPNADGTDDVARITYALSRRSRLSVYLVGMDGVEHVLREGVSRPPGSYELLFSGVIGSRLLPDGKYWCRFRAVTDDGEQAQVTEMLTIEGGQADFIEIRNLNIYPVAFTPNRDGIDDRVTVAYYLTREATNVQVYLTDDEGNKYPIPEDKIRPAGQVGNHEHDYEGGVDLGATPPPDGTYRVVVEAEDAVGNRDVATGQLTIVNGGVPQAEIVNRAAEWSSTVVPLGGTLTFTCTLRNIGNVGVRTTGPEPGTVYSTSENFNSKAFYEEPGVFRIGLDYEGNSSGRVYPFRWQVGSSDELTVIEGQRYLMPGQTATVTGHLQIVDAPVKVVPYYWLGLIHEQVAIVEDRVEPVPITIGF
jgi:hypothetical protein